MKNAGLAVVASLLCAALSAQRQAFIEAGYLMENKTYGESIGTVNCYVSGAPMSDPAIQLNSGDWLELHFDLLGPEYLDYTLVPFHCDAAWHPTDLEANEYIQGFTELNITDFEDSFNTRVPYVHYTVNFPNDLMKPRISGNYLLAVVHEGDGQQAVLTRRVVVYEQVCPLHLEAKLSSGSSGLVHSIGMPAGVEVGVIAAGHDLLVREESTRPDVPHEHVTIPCMHSTLLVRRDALRQVVAFLRTGRFLTTA